MRMIDKLAAMAEVEKIALPLAKTTKVRRALAKVLAKRKPKPKDYKMKMGEGGVAY